MNRLIESLDYCNRIICVGKSLAKDISDYAPSIKDKIAHIPHGIDTAIFNPTEQVSDAKHTYNWNPDKSHILTVGNLFHVKGFDILLKAFAGLKPLSNYHLHIVTPREDSETRQEIDAIIMEKDLNGHITFYDRKTPNELAGFYRSADLFISSSRKEGFGLVVAEAIACGTPVIATMSGGPEEIITEETGRVSSIENLEESLKKTLPSLNKFDKLKLHNYIKCEFSTSSKKEKLNSLYASVLD
jgi:glycosyltransferase involved in cell wall biosynthesis